MGNVTYFQFKYFYPLHCFWFLDDTLFVNTGEDIPEDSSFLEAVKQMKEKKYENIVELCTQQIELGMNVPASGL